MYSPNKSETRTLNRETVLKFKTVDYKDIPLLRPFLMQTRSRSCDFTTGGLLIWKDLFKYEYCIYEDTLFIKSLSEDGSGRTAFLPPVGRLPLYESIELLREYCSVVDIPLLFTAVPEDMLDDFILRTPTKIEELDGWADYIYNASALTTLKGKAYNKKRNHVNRFINDNPEYILEDISRNNVHEVEEFFSTLGIESAKADEDMADFEWRCCAETLRHYFDFDFVGGFLRDNYGKIVAFTLGEISGDTLILHIEKMEHLVAGSGEAINKMFAERMTLLHPEIRYINREDDAGDPGLRYAKESYHPEFLLKKYNVEF